MRPGRTITADGTVSVAVMAALGCAAGLIVAPRSSALFAVAVCAVVVATGLLCWQLRPRVLLGGYLAAQLFGVGTVVVYTAGLFDIRLSDLLFAMVAIRVLGSRNESVLRSPAGRSWGLFLGWLGLTLVPLVGEATFQPGVVSWLRLCQTALVALLVIRAVVDERGVVAVLRMVVIIGSASIAVQFGLAAGDLEAVLQARAHTLLNTNVLGLLSAVVVVVVRFGGVFHSAIWRMTIMTTGLVGLLLAKSVGSIIALVGAYAVGSFMSRAGATQPRLRAVRIALTAAVPLAIAVVLIAVFRPEVMPGHEDFGASGAAERLLFGAAGLLTFFNHPVIGIGWQQAVLRAGSTLADPAVVDTLRPYFGFLAYGRYERLETAGVHNAYIQIAAEAGIAGLLLLGLAIVRLKREMGRALASPGVDRHLGVTLVSCLVLIAIWWNDSALFGGQPESAMTALFVGLAIAFSRSAPRVAVPGGGTDARSGVAAGIPVGQGRDSRWG